MVLWYRRVVDHKQHVAADSLAARGNPPSPIPLAFEAPSSLSQYSMPVISGVLLSQPGKEGTRNHG
jgi:hypothetical protein